MLENILQILLALFIMIGLIFWLFEEQINKNAFKKKLLVAIKLNPPSWEQLLYMANSRPVTSCSIYECLKELLTDALSLSDHP
ncbi:hypothetical protein ACFL4X_02710, partial [Gemmatimonadota bacterium]